LKGINGFASGLREGVGLVNAVLEWGNNFRLKGINNLAASLRGGVILVNAVLEWPNNLVHNSRLRSAISELSEFIDTMIADILDYIPNSLIRFSMNPLAALKIAADTVLLHLSSQESRPEIERRIEIEKAIYPGDIIKHWPIGSTVLWVTLFLLVYLLVYFL
jgi:hypothetical protein